ncbi:MAG: ParB/RepB/Spo0J family partition protein [Eubacterium sp.]|nr:ParB/RepB/Spo0J family partition protein [Eubacterium sp.]
MSKQSSASKIKLNGFNDLFGMTDSDNLKTDVRDVMLDELYPFEGHPFKVKDDVRMEELVASIKEHGVLVPGIARIRSKGGYEIITGHSRKKACELAGLTTMPMYIRNLTDDLATIVMVDSNIQREDVLPSEKARAYKMKYDAVKHQGKKGNSLAAMGEESGESGKMIQRYIWLSRLSDELLDLVDSKKLGIVQGVDVSFLKNKEQEWVLSVIEKTDNKMSSKQSASLKKLSQSGELSEAKIWEILSVNSVGVSSRKVTLKSDVINKYFADFCTEKEIEEIIISLLDQWKAKGE